MDFLTRTKPKPSLPRDSAMKNLIRRCLSLLKIMVCFFVAILCPLLIAYTFPNLKYFFLEVAPRFWKFFSKFLTPPYLFLLLNSIIVTIAFTNRLQKDERSVQEANKAAQSKLHPTGERQNAVNNQILGEIPLVDFWKHGNVLLPPNEQLLMHKKAVSVSKRKNVVTKEGETAPRIFNSHVEDVRDDIRRFTSGDTAFASESENETDSESATSSYLDEETSAAFTYLDQQARSELSGEKGPLSFARFDDRKRKVISDGNTLGISQSIRKGDTLEATWRAINEGRHPPLDRHLGKSDTWDAPPTARSSLTLLKSERFGHAAISSSSTSQETFAEDSKVHQPKIRRREPSMSQDELNRRVEAFIAKCKKQIRLQRQE